MRDQAIHFARDMHGPLSPARAKEAPLVNQSRKDMFFADQNGQDMDENERPGRTPHRAKRPAVCAPHCSCSTDALDLPDVRQHVDNVRQAHAARKLVRAQGVNKPVHDRIIANPHRLRRPEENTYVDTSALECCAGLRCSRVQQRSSTQLPLRELRLLPLLPCRLPRCEPDIYKLSRGRAFGPPVFFTGRPCQQLACAAAARSSTQQHAVACSSMQ